MGGRGHDTRLPAWGSRAPGHAEGEVLVGWGWLGGGLGGPPAAGALRGADDVVRGAALCGAAPRLPGLGLPQLRRGPAVRRSPRGFGRMPGVCQPSCPSLPMSPNHTHHPRRHPPHSMGFQPWWLPQRGKHARHWTPGGGPAGWRHTVRRPGRAGGPRPPAPAPSRGGGSLPCTSCPRGPPHMVTDGNAWRRG